MPTLAKPKIKFTKWQFQEGTSEIVAAPSEVAEGVKFAAYAGYRTGGGTHVSLGPRPATMTYDEQKKNGEWETGITDNAPQEAYALTEWSDNKHTGRWDRRDPSYQIILTGGGNPKNSVDIKYKYD